MARKNSKSQPAEVSPGKYKSPEDRKGGHFDEYEVRSALETVTRAIKIKKNSALMRAVRAEARRQLDAAESTKKALLGE